MRRLPAKQTTRHVAKPKRLEGSVTNDGRMKVVDNQTGRAKYINARIGMALDNGGDITHERF